METQQTNHLKELRFNLNDMKTTFLDFKTRIGAIGNVCVGDKLSMNTHNVYSVYPSGKFQSLQRWWYAESRKTTLRQLSKNFLEYIQFVDMCVDATRVNPFDPVYLELCYDHIEFQDAIREGIQNLKKTYETDAEADDEDAQKICKYLNVLLDTMTQFKIHVIRRAYRRLYRSKLAEGLHPDVLDKTTVDGRDIEWTGDHPSRDCLTSKGAYVKHSVVDEDDNGENREKGEKNTTCDVECVRKQPNSLDVLEQVYPGDSAELRKHAQAVERGDEETSSFYDSDEEQEYIQHVRKRMKQGDRCDKDNDHTSGEYDKPHTYFSKSITSLDEPYSTNE